MFRFILRSLWRLIIFLLGVGALYGIVVALWPDSGSRPAAFISLLITYCLMAYIVIPNLMRLFHVFSRPNHIPLYAATGDGWPSDPVTLAIIAKNKSHLRRAMKDAGWYEADPLTFRNGFRELISIAFNKHYPQAPLSQLYLFDRPHDIGFEIPTNTAGSARTRHHVRFWRLDKPHTESRYSSHYDFWRKKLTHVLGVKREVWIGAATEETHAVDIQWRTGRLTHGGSDDAEKERDFIIATLQQADHIKQVVDGEPGESLKFRGQQFRTFYITDGGIKVVKLRSPIKK